MEKDSSVVGPGGTRRALITYSVLTGVTPLIPVPLADDLARDYFRRRLIRTLADAHHLSLSPETIKALTAERRSGCLGGCLAQLLIYPLKKAFRKIFYFLEWKRAVDLTSYTLHYGYLVDYAFGAGLLGGAGRAGRSVDEVRAAIDEVCREAPIKPVEGAVRAAFRQSRAVLVSAAGMLERSLRRVAGRLDEDKVKSAVGAVEEEERREIKGLTDRLQQKIENIPEAHFKNLRARLDARLAQEGGAAGHGGEG